MSGFDPWIYAERYGEGRNAEKANQTALFMWANMAYRFGLVASGDAASYTERGIAQKHLDANLDFVHSLKWLHAIHNQGHGDATRGAQAKAEGVKAGVFDMFLPVPMQSDNDGNNIYMGNGHFLYAGLYLELKVGSNSPSDKQNEFSADMKKVGYATAVAWGWLEARNIILHYLGLTT